MSDPFFEPEITAFMCIYCGYMAADTAGSLRINYPSNIKLIRLPCTGKTDPRYILKAFFWISTGYASLNETLGRISEGSQS